MNMNYSTRTMGSSVYEFPYSGSSASSIPFLNYNPNNPSAAHVYPTSQYPMNQGNNTLVYHLSDNTSLERVLRQLGVDPNSLHSSSTSSKSYYTNASTPVEFIFQPPRHRRRRRVICREITDSESDDDDDDRRHTSSRHHHSRSHQSSTNLHNILGKTRRKANNASPSNTRSNTNSQWQAMQNQSPPMPSQQQGSVGNMWNAATTPRNQSNSAVTDVWNNVDQNGQYGQSSNPNPPYNQMPGGPSSGMNSMWGRMSGAAPPSQQQSSPFNSPYNQMSGPPSGQQSSPGADSMWSRMSGAAPPSQQQSSPFNSPYNQTSGPPSGQQSSPGANSMWSRMSGAAPPLQQQSSPPYNSPYNQTSGPPSGQQSSPGINSFWNQMSGGGSPPQGPAPYSSPQMGGSQQGPYPSAAPRAFASLFGQPNA